MENVVFDAIFLVIFYGLEFIAILLLIGSAIYARELAYVITLGVVAAVLMFVELFLWLALIVIGSSGGSVTSNNEFIIPLKILAVVSVVSLLIYFPIVVLRARRRQRIAAQPAVSNKARQ